MMALTVMRPCLLQCSTLLCIYGQRYYYFQQSMEQPSVYGFILPTLLVVVVNRTEKCSSSPSLLSSPFAPGNLVSRDGFVWSSRPSRVNPHILHTQAEFGAYSRDSSRFPRRRPFSHRQVPPGRSRVCRVTHLLAYRCRSFPA